MANQNLFNTLLRVCNFTALQSDMAEIINAVHLDTQLQEAKGGKLPTLTHNRIESGENNTVTDNVVLSNQKPEGGKCETCRCNPCSSACPITEPNN